MFFCGATVDFIIFLRLVVLFQVFSLQKDSYPVKTRFIPKAAVTGEQALP